MSFDSTVQTVLDLNALSAEMRAQKSMLKETLSEILSIVREPTIAGGFAVAHYARPRQTIDLDVVGIINLATYSKSLLALGYHHETNRLVNGIMLESFTKNKNQPHEEGIDFLWFENAAFEKQVVSRAEPSQMLGFPVKIVSIEDLIVMKSLSNRTKDKADLEELQKQNYDRDYVARWVSTLGSTQKH